VRRLDKNWILVRAACREFHGFDPDEESTPVEAGSKVELTRMIREGEVDGVLQFWPIVPEIVETGPFTEVLPVSGLVQDLSGTDQRLPISTFLTSEAFLDENPATVERFKGAYREAVARLVSEDDLWEGIATDLMTYDDPTVMRAVRDGWREMVVSDWDEETITGMERLFDHLLDVAGADALGVDHIPEGTFRLGGRE
jgi:NitT/TauT family transport system substrate-binding protein